MDSKEETTELLEVFALAIAKANGHPDPTAYAALVLKEHLGEPETPAE